MKYASLFVLTLLLAPLSLFAAEKPSVTKEDVFSSQTITLESSQTVTDSPTLVQLFYSNNYLNPNNPFAEGPNTFSIGYQLNEKTLPEEFPYSQRGVINEFTRTQPRSFEKALPLELEKNTLHLWGAAGRDGLDDSTFYYFGSMDITYTPDYNIRLLSKTHTTQSRYLLKIDTDNIDRETQRVYYTLNTLDQTKKMPMTRGSFIFKDQFTADLTLTKKDNKISVFVTDIQGNLSHGTGVVELFSVNYTSFTLPQTQPEPEEPAIDPNQENDPPQEETPAADPEEPAIAEETPQEEGTETTNTGNTNTETENAETAQNTNTLQDNDDDNEDSDDEMRNDDENEMSQFLTRSLPWILVGILVALLIILGIKRKKD